MPKTMRNDVEPQRPAGVLKDPLEARQRQHAEDALVWAALARDEVKEAAHPLAILESSHDSCIKSAVFGWLAPIEAQSSGSSPGPQQPSSALR